MKAQIEVEMGGTKCGECPCRKSDHDSPDLCLLFNEELFDLPRDPGKANRCPACLAKYGTDGLTNEGRYPSVADVDQKYGTGAQPDLLKRIDSALRRHESIVKAQGALSAKPDPRDAVVEAARKVVRAGCCPGEETWGLKIALAALDAEGGKG